MFIKRVLKISLKMTKYLLIFFLLLFFFFLISFTIIRKRVEIIIPDNITYDIYDINNKQFFQLTNDKTSSYVTLDNISPNIINAFISIEDKRFYDHKGIDVIRIGGAILSNIDAKYFKEGASTITQQYIRNLYLDSNKDIKRKVNEIVMAINMETVLSKDDILEGYLNTIYFGHGIYGINDACKYYFNKTPNEVTLNEACALSSIPKGPSIYSPISNFENNDRRRKLVLQELYKDKKISQEEFLKLYDEKIILSNHIKNESRNLDIFYQDIVIDELRQLSKSIDFSKYKNIKVYSNCNLDLYKSLEEIIDEEYPKQLEPLQLSLFMIDSHSKKCYLTVGSNNYNTSSYNRSIKSLRQMASCVKPFLYYKALESGFTPVTTINSSETTFLYEGTQYSPKNFQSIYPNCDITMAYAISTSDNIYALKTHIFLGTHVLKQFLEQFNFTSKIHNNLSLALGTSEVKLSELTNAYSTLASLGIYDDIKYIDRIEADSKVIYEAKSNPTQILDSSTTYILNETMTNVFDNNLRINIGVTGNYIKDLLTYKYAAKSGSTDFDNYLIGYNNNITLSIWCGYDDNKIINNQDTKFIKRIWARLIEEYMNNHNKSNLNPWYITPSDCTSIIINPTYGKLIFNDLYCKPMYFKKDNIPLSIYSL